MATYLFLADYEALSKTVNVPPEKRNLSGKFRKLRPSPPKKRISTHFYEKLIFRSFVTQVKRAAKKLIEGAR